MTAQNTVCDKKDSQKLYQTALCYLARREHTPLTLQKKLLHKGFKICAIQAILLQLEHEGFINEIRFCEAWIANRVRQAYGPVRIINELRQQGVSETVIMDQLEQHESAWPGCIQKLLQKKFSLRIESLKEKHRQINYLKSRGFTLEQIKESIADR